MTGGGREDALPAAASAAMAARLGRLTVSHGLAVCGLAVRGAAGRGPAGDFGHFLELAVAMGAPQLRVTAPPYSGGDVAAELSRLAGLLAGRAGQAQDAGVRLLVELAPGTLVPGPEWFRRIAGTLPPDRIGAVYDPGATLVEGHVAAGLAVAALGPYLQHVGVRDMVLAADRANLGLGQRGARRGRRMLARCAHGAGHGKLPRLAGDRPPERDGRASRRGWPGGPAGR